MLTRLGVLAFGGYIKLKSAVLEKNGRTWEEGQERTEEEVHFVRMRLELMSSENHPYVKKKIFIDRK